MGTGPQDRIRMSRVCDKLQLAVFVAAALQVSGYPFLVRMIYIEISMFSSTHLPVLGFHNILRFFRSAACRSLPHRMCKIKLIHSALIQANAHTTPTNTRMRWQVLERSDLLCLHTSTDARYAVQYEEMLLDGAVVNPLLHGSIPPGGQQPVSIDAHKTHDIDLHSGKRRGKKTVEPMTYIFHTLKKLSLYSEPKHDSPSSITGDAPNL